MSQNNELAESITEFPTDSRTLIEYFDAVIPARCRGIKEGEREHDRYAGQRELVDRMIALQNIDDAPSY